MGAAIMNEQLTSTWTVLDEAHRALRTVVAGIRPADWTRPTPCTQWNVAQVLQHAAGDQLGYAASITGTGWPTFDPFAPTGKLPAPKAADGTQSLDSTGSAHSAEVTHGAKGAEGTDGEALATFAEST